MKTKYIRTITYALVASLVIFACKVEDLERANLVSFQAKTVDVVAPLTGTANNELKVYTIEKTGSARTFNILVDATSTADPASYTVPETVTIPANSNEGTFTVEASAASIGKKIVLKFEPTDEAIVGPPITITVYEQCLENLLFLDVKFDTYSEEFAWEILDSDGVFVAGNEDFGDYAGSAYSKKQVRLRICLPDGDYTFAAYDAYGDGLSDGTITGFFSLKRVSDGAVLAYGEGAFDNGAEFDFTLP